MRRQGRVREVDEHALAVAQRRDPDQSPTGLAVSSCVAEEPPDVLVSQLDLDRDGTASALENLNRYFVRLLRQRLGNVLHRRAVVDAGSARSRPVPPESAAAAPKVTPWGSTSLHVAQGFPPASTGCAPPRSAARPAAATSLLFPRRSWPAPVRSSGHSTR